MGYSPSQLNPKIQSQIASSPEARFHLTMESMKEASFAQHFDSTKDGSFEAVVISGNRTGESTGAGTDAMDSRIITINGKNYLEILVKTESGKGATYPNPNDVPPEQRGFALRFCEWARSAVPIEGVPTPPNPGDIVTCFYEKGSQRNSNFDGLRYQTSGISQEMLNQLMMGQGGGNFVGPLSPMAIAALGAENGKLDPATAQATVALFQSTFLKKNFVWDERFNIVGVRDRSGGPGVYSDFEYVFINMSFDQRQGPRNNPVDNWEVFKWEASTKPGKYFLQASYVPKLKNGRLAIFKEGQWKPSHKIRCHRCGDGMEVGYTALSQRRSVEYFQDSNGDGQYTYTNPTRGSIGLNIHKVGAPGDPTRDAKRQSTNNRASLGCQVFSLQSEFMDFLGLVYTQMDPSFQGPVSKYGKRYPETQYTYTLLRTDEMS